jgi:hypothetical protein
MGYSFAAFLLALGQNLIHLAGITHFLQAAAH